MRSILLHIFKYLLWALLIIAVLLYMNGSEIQSQAPVLLGGVVIIDVVFWVTELIYKAIAKSRRRKASKAASEAAKKARSAGDAVAETLKDTGTVIAGAAGNTWGVLKEKGSEVGAALKEKSSEVGTALREKLSGGAEEK